MSLKSPIIALLLLGVGFVVGLPMGKMSDHPALAKADKENTAAGQTGGAWKSSAHGSSKKTAAASDNSLLARLLALYEREDGGSWTSDWTEFDRLAADLINGYDTAELSALAIQLGQTKKSATPTAVLSAVFIHWARRDAGAAWQAALSALPEHRAETLAACLLAMTSTDHLAALKRVDAIKDESLREQAKQILTDKADRFWQPEAQARRLISMPESERPKGLLEKTIMSWGSQHLRPALEFVKSLPQTEREALLPEF